MNQITHNISFHDWFPDIMIGFPNILKQGVGCFCWHLLESFISRFDESFVFSQISQINLKNSIQFNFFYNCKNWKKGQNLTMTTRAMATPITIAKKTPKAKKLWIIGLLFRGTCGYFRPCFVPNRQARLSNHMKKQNKTNQKAFFFERYTR